MRQTGMEIAKKIKSTAKLQPEEPPHNSISSAKNLKRENIESPLKKTEAMVKKGKKKVLKENK